MSLWNQTEPIDCPACGVQKFVLIEFADWHTEGRCSNCGIEITHVSTAARTPEQKAEWDAFVSSLDA